MIKPDYRGESHGIVFRKYIHTQKRRARKEKKTFGKKKKNLKGK